MKKIIAVFICSLLMGGCANKALESNHSTTICSTRFRSDVVSELGNLEGYDDIVIIKSEDGNITDINQNTITYQDYASYKTDMIEEHKAVQEQLSNKGIIAKFHSFNGFDYSYYFEHNYKSVPFDSLSEEEQTYLGIQYPGDKTKNTLLRLFIENYENIKNTPSFKELNDGNNFASCTLISE